MIVAGCLLNCPASRSTLPNLAENLPGLEQTPPTFHQNSTKLAKFIVALAALWLVPLAGMQAAVVTLDSLLCEMTDYG